MSTNVIEKIQIVDKDSLMIGDKKFERIKQIGQGKSGKVYLYRNDDEAYAVKFFEYGTHDKMINAIPIDEILRFELETYKILESLEIPIPKLIGFDTERQILIKQLICGENIIDMIADNKLTSQIFEMIFNISKSLSAAGYHVDFFPANFMFDGEKMWYVDYEIHSYIEEWSFEQWGIYYWLNPSGIKGFLETKDGDFINKPGTVKPYDNDEVKAKRDELVKQYST